MLVYTADVFIFSDFAQGNSGPVGPDGIFGPIGRLVSITVTSILCVSYEHVTLFTII